MRRASLFRATKVGAGLVIALVALVALGGSGCGSRGPLDDEPLASADAAVDVVPNNTIEVDAATDAAPPPDAKREGGSILGCGTCLVDQCLPPITTCLQNAACRTVFQCVISECLAGGGGLDTACILQCASSDPSGALQVLSIFQCVTGKCGEDCGPLLGSLGGLGGGGVGGGGGGKKNKASPKMSAPIVQAFSQWPELCGPVSE